LKCEKAQITAIKKYNKDLTEDTVRKTSAAAGFLTGLACALQELYYVLEGSAEAEAAFASSQPKEEARAVSSKAEKRNPSDKLTLNHTVVIEVGCMP
jgi:hypothetical protein